MPKKLAETEVVQIRLGTEQKKRLQEIAERECRTFADQCRYALAQWLKQNDKQNHS